MIQFILYFLNWLSGALDGVRGSDLIGYIGVARPESSRDRSRRRTRSAIGSASPKATRATPCPRTSRAAPTGAGGTGRGRRAGRREGTRGVCERAIPFYRAPHNPAAETALPPRFGALTAHLPACLLCRNFNRNILFAQSSDTGSSHRGLPNTQTTLSQRRETRSLFKSQCSGNSDRQQLAARSACVRRPYWCA